MKRNFNEQKDNDDSLSKREPTFSEQVDAVLAGKYNRFDALKVCDTPQILLDAGLQQLPILYTQNHLKDAVHEKSKNNPHWHGLSVEQLKKIPQLLETPAILMDSLNNDGSVVAVLPMRDNDNALIFATIKPNGAGTYEYQLVNSNFMLSIYGKEKGFERYIERAVEENKILYWNKEKSQEIQCAELLMAQGLNILDSNRILHQTNSSVNNIAHSAEKSINQSNLLIEDKIIVRFNGHWGERGWTYDEKEFDIGKPSEALDFYENASLPKGISIHHTNGFVSDAAYARDYLSELIRREHRSSALETHHVLKENEVKNLEIVTQEEFNRIVDALYQEPKPDYKNIPNIIRLPAINEQLAKELGVENANFFLKANVAHVRPERKSVYNQDLRIEEMKGMLDFIRNTNTAYIDSDGRNKNFMLVGFDSKDKAKANKIVFNQDELGNYIVTIGKIQSAEFEKKQYSKVAVGVEPTIWREFDTPAPATMLRPSTTLPLDTNISQSAEKSINQTNIEGGKTMPGKKQIIAEIGFADGEIRQYDDAREFLNDLDAASKENVHDTTFRVYAESDELKRKAADVKLDNYDPMEHAERIHNGYEWNDVGHESVQFNQSAEGRRLLKESENGRLTILDARDILEAVGKKGMSLRYDSIPNAYVIDGWTAADGEKLDNYVVSMSELKRLAGMEVEETQAQGRSDFEKSEEGFFKEIDDYLDKGIRPKNDEFIVRKTPDILRLTGISENEIVIKTSVINKARNEHSLSNAEIRSAISNLADPVLIFDTDKDTSENKKDSVLLLTNSFAENGKPIALAMNLDSDYEKNRKIIQVNEIRSIHDRTLIAKNGTDLIQKWVDDGRCRYVDDKKITDWQLAAGVQFPLAVLQSVDINIQTKTQIVKASEIIREMQEQKPLPDWQQRLNATINQAAEMDDLKESLKVALYDKAEKFTDVPFSREGYERLFTDEVVQTPLETIHFADYQFDVKDKEKFMLAAYQALSNPDLIYSETINEKNLHSKNYVKTFVFDKNKKQALDVVVKTVNGQKIMISAQKRELQDLIDKIKQPEQLVYMREDIKQSIENRFSKEKQRVKELLKNIQAMPTNISYDKESAIARTTSFMKTQEKTAVRESLSAIGKAIQENSAILLKSPSFGNVIFSSGVFGDLSKKNNGGYGIKHIVEGRYVKDGLSQQDIASLLYLVKDTVETTKVKIDESKSRQNIVKDGIWVTLRKDFDGMKQNWVVTGFGENDSSGQMTKEATDAIKAVNAQYSYAPEHLFVSEQVGAVITSMDSIAQNILKSSDKERVKNFKSIYANTFFLAKNLSQEKKHSFAESLIEAEKTMIEFGESLKFALNEGAEPLQEIEFTRDNYNTLFPRDRIETPVENVKLGEHQFEKMNAKDRSRFMLASYQTLSNPDLVFKEERESGKSHNYVKSFVFDEKTKAVQDIVVSIDGENVSISAHPRNINNIVNKIKTPDQLIYAAARVGRMIEQHTQIAQSMVNPTRDFGLSTISKPLNKEYNTEKALSTVERITKQSAKKSSLADDIMAAEMRKEAWRVAHGRALPTDNRNSVRSSENKKAFASQVQGEITMAKEEAMSTGSGVETTAGNAKKDFSNSFFWQQNAQLLYESMKDGSCPPFSKEGLQKDGTVVIIPAAVRSASSGYAFKGNNQLIAQIALKKLNLNDKEILTYEQAGEKNIKRGSKHFILTTFDTENREAKRYNYYPKSAVIDVNRIPDPSEKARTPYEIAKLRRINPEKHPEVTIDARGEKNAETYIGKYLAASAMGAKFITNEKTISEMQKTLVKELEPSISQKTYAEVYRFGNRASNKCKEICSEIRKQMEQTHTKEKEQTKSLSQSESMTTGFESMSM